MTGYGDLARIYDGEYDGMTADVDHYLRALADERVAGRVLELGCGTGRIAIPLVRAGYSVTGLDLSPAMIRRARRRRRALPPELAVRLKLSLQDMRTFHFPRRFRAAVVAFSSFNLLPETHDRRACLERLAATLEPGGVLLMDLAASALAGAPVASRHVSTFPMPRRSLLAEKMVEENPDPQRRVLAIHYHYTVRRPDGAAVDSLDVRFELAQVERAELEAGLYATGFDVEAVDGDYRGTSYRSGHPRMVVRARRLG